MTDPALLAAVRQIVREELLAILQPTPARIADADCELLEALLPATFHAADNALFNVGELYRHARLPLADELRAALAPVGGARSLGKLLRRAVGVPVGGFVVERVGADRAGALWRVSRVSEGTEPRRGDSALPAHR
jgi:hypothetical protein